MNEFLENLAREAGERLLDYFKRIDQLAIDHKSERDLVTEADRALESFLVERILARYPDHSINGEESGRHAGSEMCWVIDPIDGTASFVHGQPYFSISIAVQEHGRTVSGCVYAPVMDELFLASRGSGATRNGQPIAVSGRGRLIDSMMATGFACIRSDLKRNNLPYFSALLPRLRDVRRYGSAALDLCYVACGRLEGFWELNLHDYDVAAGILILEEAGGLFTDFDGGSENIYAENLGTNRAIHKEVVQLFREVEIARGVS